MIQRWTVDMASVEDPKTHSRRSFSTIVLVLYCMSVLIGCGELIVMFSTMLSRYVGTVVSL